MRKPAAKVPARAIRSQSPETRVPEQWQWHYRILRELRNRVVKDSADQLAEASLPVERYGSHMGDSGSDEFDHERALGLLAEEQDRLFEIEAAIQRILKGRYGICEETGQSIPAARLRAVPWTRYAKRVEERLEQRGVAGEPQSGDTVAFHSVPQGPRARDQELNLEYEDMQEKDLAEEPELLSLSVPAGQREDVIEALENGIEGEPEVETAAKTKTLSADEPISPTEL